MSHFLAPLEQEPMRRSTLYLAGVFALAFSASSMAAQAASQATAGAMNESRKGFFVSGGLGYGSAGLDCDGCTSDRENGLSGYFRIGGTIDPHVRLGFESNGWVKSTNGVDTQIAFWTGDIYIYPSVSNNFWLKGGVGLATAKASDDTQDLKSNGVAVSAGVGYDWAVNHGNFVIVPFAGYLRQLSGKVKFNGEDTGVSANADLFQVGIGLGYRH